MDWVERLNQSMEYIEAHLAEEINYEQIGRIACCSAYHFQRMFTYMAGMTLSEYIRRRRMSLAAVDLQNRETKVIDVAEKYGYRSPTAFNRAFQSVHGFAPTAVRKEGAVLKSFPPLSFHLSVTGGAQLEYRIERKEAFPIIGIFRPLFQGIEENFMIVPKMWQEAAADGTLQKLAERMTPPPGGVLGVSVCDEQEQWRYYIAVASPEEQEEFETFIVPASTWAVFPGTGTSQSMQELQRRIVTEWLPGSGYEYANAPDVEVYLNPDPQDARYEVWIPVTKKGQS